MPRRRYADEPTSRLAIWARRCAFFSLTAALLSILIVRSGILEPIPALATFGGALVFAVLGIVLAFGAFIVIWKDGINNRWLTDPVSDDVIELAHARVRSRLSDCLYMVAAMRNIAYYPRSNGWCQA